MLVLLLLCSLKWNMKKLVFIQTFLWPKTEEEMECVCVHKTENERKKRKNETFPSFDGTLFGYHYFIIHHHHYKLSSDKYNVWAFAQTIRVFFLLSMYILVFWLHFGLNRLIIPISFKSKFFEAAHTYSRHFMWSNNIDFGVMHKLKSASFSIDTNSNKQFTLFVGIEFRWQTLQCHMLSLC